MPKFICTHPTATTNEAGEFKRYGVGDVDDFKIRPTNFAPSGESDPPKPPEPPPEVPDPPETAPKKK